MPPGSEPIETEPIQSTVAISLDEYRQELRNAELSAARLAREVTCPYCRSGLPVRFIGHSQEVVCTLPLLHVYSELWVHDIQHKMEPGFLDRLGARFGFTRDLLRSNEIPCCSQAIIQTFRLEPIPLLVEVPGRYAQAYPVSAVSRPEAYSAKLD
jgi:hypothetical protein